jgi:hypothetical protein
MRSLVLTLALCVTAAIAAEPSAVLTDYGKAPPAATTTQTTPNPLPPLAGDGATARAKAVSWVLEHQHADGGWASGNFGTTGAEAGSDVATTAFSVMALSRDANGRTLHDAAITKGVEYVIKAVETAPPGPKLATPDSTQIQYKLGPLVDTHLASLMLAELLPTLKGELATRAKKALQTCVDKVELAQNADGSFDGNAWAPVLSTSIAAQSLTKASNLGIEVDEKVLARSDAYQAATVGEGGAFDTSSGAGVELYAVAGSLRSNAMAADRAGAAAPPAEAKARAEAVEAQAMSKVSGDASGLIQGFGSIGGEEMLSYMMISDTLAEKGGKEFTDWQTQIGHTLASAQNADGSWVGHHCITSQAFATAGGVLVWSAGDHASIATRIRG